MSKLETNTIDTISGTTTLQVGDSNVATINLGKSGDTINVPTGATLTVPSGGLSGQNYPAFLAYQSSAQSISNSTVAKVNLQTEIFDTDSAFDSTTNYRFTPQVAGKYVIYAQTRKDTFTASRFQAVLKLNGSTNQLVAENGNGGTNDTAFGSTVVELNGSTDYIELFTFHNNGSTQDLQPGISSTYFGAYRIGA